MNAATSDGGTVLIAGAGPTGLTLAHELMRQGVRVRLIDRAPEPSPNIRAVGVWTRTLELFARTRSGIADEMLEQGLPSPTFSVWSGGRRLAHLDLANRIEGPFAFVLMLPQPDTEALLARHVVARGGAIERGVELVGLTDHGDGVEAVLRHASGVEERTRAAWLVGCDGAHSAVRELLGVPFAGTTLEQTFIAGDIRMEWAFAPDEALGFLHGGSFVLFFPLPESGRYRLVIAAEPGAAGQGDVTLDEIQHDVAAYGPAGARASDPLRFARFLVNQRKVERYVCGRVVLAGDAAHTHSFIGGQGMNTGIQDAFNLAWKLALVVRGRAPERLLASYEQEREHVSRDLLAATGLASRVALTQNPLLTALRDALMPHLTALSATQQRVISALAELSISYRESPIVRQVGGGGRLHAGDRAPDGDVEAGGDGPRRLFDLLSGTRHTLLVCAGPGAAPDAARLVEGFEDVVETLRIDPAGALAARYGLDGEGLVLVRPDGYVGFLSRTIAGEELGHYLRGLFSSEPGC